MEPNAGQYETLSTDGGESRDLLRTLCCCNWITAALDTGTSGDEGRLVDGPRQSHAGLDNGGHLQSDGRPSLSGRGKLVDRTLAALQEAFETDDDEEPADPASKLGRLHFSIWYEFSMTTLTLKIIEAEKLIAKDLNGTSDPYVEVLLLPNKKDKLKTQVKHKTLNPRWNEVFAFEGFPYEKVINSTLCMRVFDHDRFSKDDVIGELIIPMTSFDLNNGQTLWKNLQPSGAHSGKLGELCISLCYDSTASLLSVTVNRARNLKAKDINGLSDPYIKIWLVQNGRRIEKKKTTVRDKTLNPVFEETLTFDVNFDQLRSTCLEVFVVDFDRIGRNEAIGRIVLGSKSGPNEVKHWNEMLSKAKMCVMKWHVLKYPKDAKNAFGPSCSGQ